MTLSAPANPAHRDREGVSGERGVAVLIALLFAALIGAVAAGLIALSTTETLIGASVVHAWEDLPHKPPPHAARAWPRAAALRQAEGGSLS